jgi:hypothetical protein
MCILVAATLPDRSSLGRLASLTDLPVEFQPVSNKEMERQLMPGEVLCAVVGLERGGCYCGTVLGRVGSEQSP